MVLSVILFRGRNITRFYWYTPIFMWIASMEMNNSRRKVSIINMDRRTDKLYITITHLPHKLQYIKWKWLSRIGVLVRYIKIFSLNKKVQSVLRLK